MADQSQEIIIRAPESASIGQIANQAAQSTLLQDYRSRRSAQTLRRQAADVALFEQFLAEAGAVISHDLAGDLAGWSGVTHGLVKMYVGWQLREGYAIGSINVRLATIKVYCELAMQAGYLPAEAALIKTVKGYAHKEKRNIDEKREQTRRPDAKKAATTLFTEHHAKLLKKQPDSKRGRRDSLLMCLLLDLGMRVGEVAALDVASIDLAAGLITFDRPKVDKLQRHQLTADCWYAARAYLADCPPGQGPLFVGSCSKVRVNERSLYARVVVLGRAVGIGQLSPHDCRHFWTTDALKSGSSVKAVQTAGGWSGPTMVFHYAEAAEIANEGIKLSSMEKSL